jgi:hypothetical protein
MTTIKTCHVERKFAQACLRTTGFNGWSFDDLERVAIRTASDHDGARERLRPVLEDHRQALSAGGREAGMPSGALTFTESLRDNASWLISSFGEARRIDLAFEDANRFQKGAQALLGKRTPGSER